MIKLIRYVLLVCILNAALVYGVVLAAAGPSHDRPTATSFYDGVWSVLIMTDSGTCDQAYRYAVRITSGIVQKRDPTNGFFDIAGHVNRGGRVSVIVSNGQQAAIGVGRLSRRLGRGTWHAASGQCSGRWTAERRPSDAQ